MIKVVACDVYGTILATDDPENACPLRDGFMDFALEALERKITLISVSDNDPENTRIDLMESRVPSGLFTAHFEMSKQGKDFTPILHQYDLAPRELLVIGDQLRKDIVPALRLGCRTVRVPEYKTVPDEFNFKFVAPFLSAA